jgi:hypothetical protein
MQIRDKERAHGVFLAVRVVRIRVLSPQALRVRGDAGTVRSHELRRRYKKREKGAVRAFSFSVLAYLTQPWRR